MAFVTHCKKFYYIFNSTVPIKTLFFFSQENESRNGAQWCSYAKGHNNFVCNRESDSILSQYYDFNGKRGKFGDMFERLDERK